MILRGLRRAALFVLALMIVAAAWEFYKAVGPEKGGEILGVRILPRSSERAMPHTWEMGQRLFDPEVRGQDRPIWLAVLGYSWFTFRMALVGFALGCVFGMSLAVVMARFSVVERGLLPYVVASQTVPLIALAPQVVSTGVRGVGFAALTYAQKATSDPAQVYTAVFGAALLGLSMFGLVVAIELLVMRNRPAEAN